MRIVFERKKEAQEKLMKEEIERNRKPGIDGKLNWRDVEKPEIGNDSFHKEKNKEMFAPVENF
jgi:hypothetical protein